MASGTGGKCGASAIDSRLYQLLSQRYRGALDSILLENLRPGSNFMGTFEAIKRKFNGEKDRTWQLRLNSSEFMGAPACVAQIPGMIILQSKDLHDLFDPVVSKILEQILTQISSAEKRFRRRVITVSFNRFISAVLFICFTNHLWFDRKLSLQADSANPPTSRVSWKSLSARSTTFPSSFLITREIPYSWIKNIADLF